MGSTAPDFSIHAQEGQTHFKWDRSLEPILSVEPGQTVAVRVSDASGGQLSKDSPVDALASLDFNRLNPVTGPIFVKGARPGDTLEVELLAFTDLDWGWSAIIPGFGLLTTEFPDPYLKIWDVGNRDSVVFKDGIEIPVNPFPGTIGVAPAEDGEYEMVPPHYHGGNMDCRHLTAGTRVWFPVHNEGALFSIGDTHTAQGDGEVCGTAIETSMTAVVRFDVIRNQTIDMPHFDTPGNAAAPRFEQGYHGTTGIADNLKVAAEIAVAQMIEYLTSKYALTEQEAYVLCSVAADLTINEVVDAPNWVVSALMPHSIFAHI